MTHKKHRLGLTINATLYDKLKDIAEYQGKTLNATCVDIFWCYFERNTELKDAHSKKQQ